MAIEIIQITPDDLWEYARVPSAFTVKSIFQVDSVDGGLGGLMLKEIPVEPYVKSYDREDNSPLAWPVQFDLREWGLFLARDGKKPVGGAAVGLIPGGNQALEARPSLCELWDIRILLPEYCGVGIPLFRTAARWARLQGYQQMKVETQNVNVPACCFYQRMGCTLGVIHQFGYAAVPVVSHEVMLNWYLTL